MTITSSNNYHDFGALSEFRGQAANQSPKAIAEVAKQLESVFLNMVLKTMRESNESFESDIFASSQNDMYEQMHDQQLSLAMSKAGGIGLAEIIEKQLRFNTVSQVKEP